MADNDAPGAVPVWTPVARLPGFITLLHTKYESSFFLYLSHCKKSTSRQRSGKGATRKRPPLQKPRRWDQMIRGMVGRIYREDHCTLLHTKYESSWPCGFGEDDFLCFSHDGSGAGPVWTPKARLAGFIKRTTIHCYTQNMKALGLVVLEKKIFYVFPIVSLWELMTLGAGPFLNPRAWLAGFIKRTTTHCYIQNMKGLGLMVSEKKIFFLCFLIVSLWEIMTPKAGPFLTQRGMVGRIYKEDHYTLLHTTHENSGHCGFGEEDFFMFFPWRPGAWPVWTQGARLAGFIKWTTIYCYTQDRKALCLVVSEKKIIYIFHMISLWELMTPGAGPFLTPVAWLAGVIKSKNKTEIL